MNILYTTMTDRQNIVSEFSFVRLDFQQTILESFVREIILTQRVHDAHPVHLEMIRIHIRSRRTQRYRPDAGFLVERHVMFSCKLNIYGHLFSLSIVIIERHRPIVITDGLGGSRQ